MSLIVASASAAYGFRAKSLRVGMVRAQNTPKALFKFDGRPVAENLSGKPDVGPGAVDISGTRSEGQSIEGVERAPRLGIGTGALRAERRGKGDDHAPGADVADDHVPAVRGDALDG